MQDSRDIYATGNQPEPDSVQRLLFALGAWGVAEVNDEPGPMLDELSSRAQDAYNEVAAVA